MNLLKNPVGHGLDQRIQGLIRLPKAFDLPDRVKNGGMVATVVKSADLGPASSCCRM
jgi:hypothetical protein